MATCFHRIMRNTILVWSGFDCEIVFLCTIYSKNKSQGLNLLTLFVILNESPCVSAETIWKGCACMAESVQLCS